MVFCWEFREAIEEKKIITTETLIKKAARKHQMRALWQHDRE